MKGSDSKVVLYDLHEAQKTVQDLHKRLVARELEIMQLHRLDFMRIPSLTLCLIFAIML